MTTPRTKVLRRPVHGVLLLDKPLGWSSNDALQKVKWLLRAEKAGHTGTLDPLATGVLPLCFGAATKFSQLQLDADKTYAAKVKLGEKTSTGDAEGEVFSRRDVRVTQADLERVTAQFTGPILQTPPMYSALKKDGIALYAYARAGVTLEREARAITIYTLKTRFIDENCAQPAIELLVKCSKGTYIRTLGEDLGEALGCGGHLTALRRLETGGFLASQSHTLEALTAMTEDERRACLLPVDALLENHLFVPLIASEAGRFLSGLRRRGNWPDALQVAVYAEAEQSDTGSSDAAQGGVGRGQAATLLGTAHCTAGELIPDRLLNPAEIAEILKQNTPATAVENPTAAPVLN